MNLFRARTAAFTFGLTEITVTSQASDDRAATPNGTGFSRVPTDGVGVGVGETVDVGVGNGVYVGRGVYVARGVYVGNDVSVG